MEEYAKAGPLVEHMTKIIDDAQRTQQIREQYAEGFAAYDAEQGKNQIVQEEASRSRETQANQENPLLQRLALELLQSGDEGGIIKKEIPIALGTQEEYAVLSYKSSESYKLNAVLRDGISLTPIQQRMMDGLDRALPKMPVYRGRVYRRVGFDLVGQEALNAFLMEHQPGTVIQYLAYTSASTAVDGYPMEGELTVTFVIQSESGRNLDGYGNNFEKEVLFPRECKFLVERVETGVNGRPIIYMKEV